MIILVLTTALGISIQRTDITGISDICGDPPIVGNATWFIADRYAQVITYTCEDGFIAGASTTFNVTCSNSTFVGAQVCIPIPCTIPAAVANGALTNVSDIINVGDMITQTCHRGYTGDGLVNGPRVIHFVCQVGDVMTPVIDPLYQCIEINCGRAPYLEDATTTADLSIPVTLYESVKYSCSPGMFVAGTTFDTQFNLTCGEDGYFVPSDYPTCVRPSCGPAPSIPLATPVSHVDSGDINEVLMYHCMSGNTLASDKTAQHFSIRCSMTGTYQADWVYSSGKVCTPIPCQATPRYTDAVLAGNQSQFFFGDIAHYQCITGYTLNGAPGAKTFTASCDTNSVWSASTLLDCQPVVCGVETDLPEFFTSYGKVVPYPMAVAIHGGAEMSVVCNEGAINTVGGNSSVDIVCGQDGYFTSKGVCSVPCPSLASVVVNANSTAAALLWYTNQSEVVTCKTGYTISGTPVGSAVTRQTAMCSRNGTYDNLKPCSPVMCSRPPLSLGQGTRSGDYADSPIPFGTSISYTCPTGYYEPNSTAPGFVVVCGADGKLTSASLCTKVVCPKAPVLANAKAVTNQYQYFYYEDVFVLNCNPGYGPAPTVFAVCQSDTTWLLDGACVPVKAAQNAVMEGTKVPESVDNSSALGASISFFIFLIFLIILVLI